MSLSYCHLFFQFCLACKSQAFTLKSNVLYFAKVCLLLIYSGILTNKKQGIKNYYAEGCCIRKEQALKHSKVY